MCLAEKGTKKPGDGAQRKSSERTIVCEMVKNVTFSLLVGSHRARERARERGWGSDLQAEPSLQICPSPQWPHYFEQQPSISVRPPNENADRYSPLKINTMTQESAKRITQVMRENSPGKQSHIATPTHVCSFPKSSRRSILAANLVAVPERMSKLAVFHEMEKNCTLLNQICIF